jgi:phosphate transport system substrate-binding protein
MTTRLGVCTNTGRCRLCATATVQEVGEGGAFKCRECGYPLAVPAQPAQPAGVTAPTPRPAGPPTRPPLPRAAGASPAGPAAPPRAAGASPAGPAAPPRASGVRLPDRGAAAAARPPGTAAPSTGAPAPRSARFPLGVFFGGSLFVLMAGFAYWVTEGWTAAPVLRPKVAAAATPIPAPLPARKAEVVLRLAGSNTIGAQLGPALAEAFLASQGVTAIQTSSGAPDEFTVQGTRDGAPQAITVAAHGSAGAFEALLGGSAEVGMSARRVRPDEVQRLAALGAMTSPASEHVLALDGIAVIASKANPVSQLGRDQLAAVFDGRITDWSAVGGTAGPVHLYVPGERSGTPDVFEAVVLRGGRLSTGARRLENNQAVLDAVVGDVAGIGLVGLPWVRGVKALAVGESRGTPMIPNAFTLAGEDYLLTRRLYLYTAGAPANPNVSRFVEFALGAQGQALVKKAGLVELTIKAEPRTPPTDSPNEYVRLTDGARRLTTTFRFVVGSSELDNRALSDLDRVVDFLREHDLNGASVKLLGFADSQGGASVNRALSRERAVHVARAFAQRGITGATLQGFGAALPVSDNASGEGRERNRRVEIWITR